MHSNHPHFFSGLSGIELPVPKYRFPEEHQKSSRLTYYATFFNSIEVNSTFYKIPMKSTIARWASSVPTNFRFTFKLFREITHAKNADFDPSLIEKFLDTISVAGEKKGCLLVQFPPSLKDDSIHYLQRILHLIKLADPDHTWHVAVEFRYKGWYNDEVYDLLNTFNASLVIQDIPRSATPLTLAMPDVIYLRFHGPTGNYRGSYSDAFLQEYASYIREWLDNGKIVYTYFNNTAGDAFQNLSTLNTFLAEN